MFQRIDSHYRLALHIYVFIRYGYYYRLKTKTRTLQPNHAQQYPRLCIAHHMLYGNHTGKTRTHGGVGRGGREIVLHAPPPSL